MQGRDIPIENNRFTAVLTEAGGGFKSFQLKDYRESLKSDSANMELVTTKAPAELPLFFSWGTDPAKPGVAGYQADRDRVAVTAGEQKLTLTGRGTNGLTISRTLTIREDEYSLGLAIQVRNDGPAPLQGAPFLSLNSTPFTKAEKSSGIFAGPALFKDGRLEEIKPDDLAKAPKNLTGKINWAAYEDTYFMAGIVPLQETVDDALPASTVDLTAQAGGLVRLVHTAPSDTIPPGGVKTYRYIVYFGPKQLTTLKKVGHHVDSIVDFGWYDIIAKPTLFLLNFLYRFLGNYGVAIILVTIIMKMLFWPIAQKGMKSMRTMQKLQPKMAKLREKYKDDQERLNQEMIRLYQTYKVNPLGGCLPMVLQIPVFFALYKVLLQTIELRHAPFLLWINDLSAPDRLFIGFDLPYLHGIPVLTILMGATMFLQQKMSPSSGDPAQQKVMLFMPIIFTFMFLNFASGLVLYWFVSNLLSILQQYLVNRQTEEAA